MLVDPAVELLRVEIARHDQGRIVRPVEILVKGPRVFQRRRVEIADRADAGALVRMAPEPASNMW
jgi:hypothetical protein